MIVDERMASFIESLDRGNTEFLNEIEKQALKDSVPVIRKPTQSLLKFMLAMKKPNQILEVGTAVAFSALLLLEYAPEGCNLTTIEKYQKRIPIAKQNIGKSRFSDQIRLIEGDAAEVLSHLQGCFDLIFMDAAKAQYIHFLPEVLRLTAPGGIIISDNVLQAGDILESRFAVTRRNRTIHARMRQYLYEISQHPLLETILLPIGDGITISLKK